MDTLATSPDEQERAKPDGVCKVLDHVRERAETARR
jgi:hypothetical protein